MRRISFRKSVAVTLSVVMALTLGSVSSASASDGNAGRPGILLWHHEELVNVSSISDITNYGQSLGGCVAGSPGITCSISVAKSATRSISLALSVTRGFVAGPLGISSEASVSVSVSCSSPPLAVGQSFSAYPRGNRYYYRIHVTQNYAPTDQLSASLTAFSPNGRYYCVVK